MTEFVPGVPAETLNGYLELKIFSCEWAIVCMVDYSSGVCKMNFRATKSGQVIWNTLHAETCMLTSATSVGIKTTSN